MKRLVPFSAVLCVCLLAGLGWVVSHPQKAAAHAVFDDDKHDGDHDRDKDKDKDKDRDCDQDGDKDRDHGDGDKDRDHNDHDYGHDGDRDHSRDDDDHKHADRNATVGSYLVTITKYGTTVVVTERAVITLHSDGTMSSVDSGQGGPVSMFSSQLGAWKRGCNGGAKGRTLDFTFPSTGINRLDYTFDANQPKNTIKGEFILTNFPIDADPQGSGGTVVGQFEFTGQRIKVPK
ncbi:MAG TPA: hypothetical protein VG649_23375 [Candidatus Angelobacter sp.]|jgi:hypothetical protein|nr:hypothetical protein [Candidatus Angelobacter sp.]